MTRRRRGTRVRPSGRLRLQPRDRAMLTWVGRAGVVELATIARTFWGESAGASSAAARRTRLLVDHGLLDGAVIALDKPNRFTLSARGADLAGPLPHGQVRRTRIVATSAAADHLIASAEVWSAMLLRLGPPSGSGLLRFLTEVEMRRALGNAKGSLIPDGLAIVGDETRSVVFAIEVDLDHELPQVSAFAASLFEHKVKVGEIRSARGRDKWSGVLTHLIEGTTGKRSRKHVAGFGDCFVDRIQVVQVDTWKLGLADLIAAGDYKPTTVNGWLAILQVIMKAAKRQLSLPHLATEGVGSFDLSEHATYSEEEPNALLPEEVGPFMETLRALHPGHYAMVFLGLVTGLRPSSLRPLRRQGSEPDVLWERNRLLVRRSHSLGDEVMRTTKQKRRYAIDLPEEAMAVLRWHVETQLKTPEQGASELLFPATTGGFRSPSVLNKPLAETAEELALGKKVTQRALRRTFNDLARTAKVHDLVTRSISGHLTEQMQQHYSTVSSSEQRDALAKVIRLFAPGAIGGEDGGEASPRSGESAKKAG